MVVLKNYEDFCNKNCVKERKVVAYIFKLFVVYFRFFSGGEGARLCEEIRRMILMMFLKFYMLK